MSYKGSMMLVAAAIVILAAAYLVLLGAATLFDPIRAERFISAFASSARAHITEQSARLVFGGALIVYAPNMRLAVVFEALGWLLLVTSVCLLLIPWRWHQRFAQWAIPLVLRYMKLYGFGAFTLGAAILVALL